MRLLEERILRDGTVKEGDVLKVDSFLNHQMDVPFFSDLAREFKRRFKDCSITKILTIEASGIGVACITAQEFGCPVLFAKKSKTKNIAGDVYTANVFSYTHHTPYEIIVSKEFLTKDDKVLIIDDFLANGAALEGLVALVNQAGAEIIGAGVVVEKAYQPGGERIRQMGVRVEALARVLSMTEKDGIKFCD
jgi:xanthine phosphoribosyltransferase